VLPDYDDIRSRISEEPTWYDDNGVPRYGAFKPEMLGVYDKYAILVEIECQSCTRLFLVGVGCPRYSFRWGQDDPILWSVERMVDGYHYGDPPRHGNCVGDTMNCIDRRVVEAWEQRDQSWEWRRVPEFEGRNLTPEWAND